MWHSFMAESYKNPPSSHVKWFRTTNISIDNLFIWRRNFNAISEETAQLNKMQKGPIESSRGEESDTGHKTNTECVINLIFMFFMHAIPMPWICIHIQELDALTYQHTQRFINILQLVCSVVSRIERTCDVFVSLHRVQCSLCTECICSMHFGDWNLLTSLALYLSYVT